MFPSNSLDNVATLMPLLGSFWTETYGGNKFSIDYLRGACLEEQQRINDFLECQNTIGRFTCPVGHIVGWYKLTISLDDATFGSGTEVSFPIPEDVLAIPVLTDAILSPLVILTDLIDYRVDRTTHTITFASSPFSNPDLSPQDGKLVLWGMRVMTDRGYLFNHFGSIINVEAPASRNYQNLINAYLDAVSAGTAWIDTIHFISAACDIAVAQADETVTETGTNVNSLYVATDKNIYHFQASDTISVAVGDRLLPGDPMTNSLRIFQPSNGMPIPPWLTAITVPPSFFLSPMSGPITWPNTVVAVTVTENVSGFTKMTWPLIGAASDITQFFDDLHARGVANGATLANYMDTRLQPQPTQPSAIALPTTINPLKFLLENVFRNNVLVVKIDPAQFGPDALGLTVLANQLRDVTPPHGTVLILT